MLHMLFMRTPENVMAVTKAGALTRLVRRADLIDFLQRHRHWRVRAAAAGVAQGAVALEDMWAVNQFALSVK